jgi:RNA 2',3'-cyclic 3'-phosphodiesterase
VARSETNSAGAKIVRLFIAYRLPAETVAALADWQQQEMAGRSGVRLLPPDHLHITVAFLGSRPSADAAPIGHILDTCAAAARRPVFGLERYRETPRVGMLVLREHALPGEQYAGRANELAGHLMRELEAGGFYQREHRSWRPHVTVARFRRPPRFTPPLPPLTVFSPAHVVLYQSVPTATGSIYHALVAAPLSM